MSITSCIVVLVCGFVLVATAAADEQRYTLTETDVAHAIACIKDACAGTLHRRWVDVIEQRFVGRPLLPEGLVVGWTLLLYDIRTGVDSVTGKYIQENRYVDALTWPGFGALNFRHCWSVLPAEFLDQAVEAYKS